jgi:hypothetical protein
VGDSDEDDTPTDDEETTDETFYTVKVDGEEYEVNLDELRKGYQLEKNYTKKAQALAEEKKEITTLKSQLEEQRNQYLKITQNLIAEQSADLNTAKKQLGEIDRSVDPIGFVQKQLEVQDLEGKLQQRLTVVKHASTEQQQQTQERMQQYLSQQNELLKSQLDGWGDAEKAKELQASIAKFALAQGYSDEDIKGLANARDVIVLNKARLYDEMVAKKDELQRKKVPEKAKIRRKSEAPKSGNTKKARDTKQKIDTFKRSGSVKDAAALLLARMPS